MSAGGRPVPAPSVAAWHRAGELAARWDQVAGLLAGADPATVTQVGRILDRLGPDAVRAEHPDTPLVRVAITGHGTLTPLVSALTGELARHGLLLQPYLGDFDSWVADLSDPARPFTTGEPDLAVCVFDPMVVFDEVPTPWRVADVEALLAAKLDLIEALVDRFHAGRRVPLVLNTLPLPRRFTTQLVDHRSRALLGAIWHEANARLLRLATTRPDLVVLDLAPLVADGGPAEDPRLSLYTHSHLSADLLAGYARQVGHLARHLTGRTKKILALDLDGTVWGGVLGDDGPEGIEVADSYRGEAFRAFQRVIKQIGSQGVLLTAVSKNDLEPVLQVLGTNPRMTLREEDFVRVTANWQPKPENLQATAEALNLGVDSIVFVDDSPFEIGLVRHELPAVTTIELDDEPALHIERLLADGWFDVREVTADDQARAGRYRDDLARNDFLQHFDSLEGYLRELNVRVRFADVTAAEINRVSQLTLRTNQFNLTTVRLQPAQVEELVARPDTRVMSVSSSDRFGENGVVGAFFLRRDDDVLHIDNILLSCRVFSRGIEQACLAAVLQEARANGTLAVHGRYRPTKKNGGAREFFPQNGFVPVSHTADETHYRHDLLEFPQPPSTVELITNQPKELL